MKLIICLCFFLLASVAGAADFAHWSETNLQYLRGSGHLTTTGDRFTQDIITLEHVDDWAYGNNFIFFDLQNTQSKSEVKYYGEITPALSLNKMGVTHIKDRYLKDIQLQGNLEFPAAPASRADLFGITLVWQNLWFDYLATQFLYRDTLTVSGVGQQLTFVWSKVFGPKEWPILFNGFLDWAGKEGTRYDNIQTQPSLLLDLNRKTNNKVPLRIGIEYNYWHNKLGIKNLNQSVIQSKLMWIL